MFKKELKECLKVAKSARKLISNKATWTRGALARDKDGFSCDTMNEKACSFCALGALDKAYREYNLPDVYGYLQGALNNKSERICAAGITYLNDAFYESTDTMMDYNVNWKNVLRAYDSVIEDLEKKIASI